MQFNIENAITNLFTNYTGLQPDKITALPASGSERKYFRIYFQDKTVIAAFNPYPRENNAFITLSRHFANKGLPVPEVHAVDSDNHCYLIKDLGDTTLFSLLPHDNTVKEFDNNLMDLYTRVVEYLPGFQVSGASDLEFSVCYPRQAFDRQSIMWDLNYFKYYYLKTSGIPFDEQLLEDDFEAFTNHLLKQPSDYFMYRDFQSRNIMIYEGQPFFIDYQGGRKGPLQYDIASLLFDAKANIPFHQRLQLLDLYIEKAGQLTSFDSETFRSTFYDFVVVRILQALGAYGFRGGIEKKTLFLQSVPFALRNLNWLAQNNLLPKVTPYLNGLIKEIIFAGADELVYEKKPGLTVTVNSFSYRNGIPNDYSGNGGGFVFDCRALPNPGRQQIYKALTGKDKPVMDYLKDSEEVKLFIDTSSRLIYQAIKNYQERNFSDLMVSFGCTGGQHRSVYCAEHMAKYISNTLGVNTIIKHYQSNHWPKPPAE